MSDEGLQIHPATAALLEEVRRLRMQLAEQLAAWHDLKDVQRPWLLALYQEKLGAWELKKLQVQTQAGRAKRRLELVQARCNEGKAADLTLIDMRLDQEFVHWQHQLKEAAAVLEQAQQWMQGTPLTPEDLVELKNVYRELVKALHPDLHPQQTEAQQLLWHRVQQAYAAQALEELRALAALQTEPGSVAEPDAMEKLHQERDRLAASLADISEKLSLAQRQPPFTLREQLADPEWVVARRTELESEIAPLEAQRDHYEQLLQQLLTGMQHGGFGPN